MAREMGGRSHRARVMRSQHMHSPALRSVLNPPGPSSLLLAAPPKCHCRSLLLTPIAGVTPRQPSSASSGESWRRRGARRARRRSEEERGGAGRREGRVGGGSQSQRTYARKAAVQVVLCGRLRQAWGIMMGTQLGHCSGGTTDVVISSVRKQAAGHAANDSGGRGVERNGIGDLQRARDGQDANRAREEEEETTMLMPRMQEMGDACVGWVMRKGDGRMVRVSDGVMVGVQLNHEPVQGVQDPPRIASQFSPPSHSLAHSRTLALCLPVCLSLSSLGDQTDLFGPWELQLHGSTGELREGGGQG